MINFKGSDAREEGKMVFCLVSVTAFDCAKAIIMTYRLPNDLAIAECDAMRSNGCVQSAVRLLLKSNLFIVFRESRTHICTSLIRSAKWNVKNIIKISLRLPLSPCLGAWECVFVSFPLRISLAVLLLCSACSQHSFIFVGFRSCLRTYQLILRKFFPEKGKTCLFNCSSASPVRLCIQIK